MKKIITDKENAKAIILNENDNYPEGSIFLNRDGNVSVLWAGFHERVAAWGAH